VSKKKSMHDEAKAPDAFMQTSKSVLHYLEEHVVIVSIVVVSALVGGTAYTGITWYQNRAESSAAEAIYSQEAELQKAETAIREERAKKMQGLAGLSLKDKKQAKPETVRPVDYAKDYASLVEKVRAQIKQHADTRAAMVSALNLSYFLAQQKQFKDALEVLNSTKSKPGTSDILGGFWRMHMGLSLLENQRPDEALKVYTEVLGAQDLKPFHPEALLKTGVAYELKGEVEKARDTYLKLGRDFPNTEASNSATQYLRLLDLKSKG
jgi:TolA-binding protein